MYLYWFLTVIPRFLLYLESLWECYHEFLQVFLLELLLEFLQQFLLEHLQRFLSKVISRVAPLLLLVLKLCSNSSKWGGKSRCLYHFIAETKNLQSHHAKIPCITTGIHSVVYPGVFLVISPEVSQKIPLEKPSRVSIGFLEDFCRSFKCPFWSSFMNFFYSYSLDIFYRFFWRSWYRNSSGFFRI